MEVPSVSCAPNIYRRTMESENREALSTSDPVIKVSSADARNSEPDKWLMHLDSE